MKKLIAALLLAPMIAMADSNGVTADGLARDDRNVNVPIPANAAVIMRSQLGSGTPGVKGLELAEHMGQGIYHAPQYMAAYPTAGVIWPRVVEVLCEKNQHGTFVCDGYDWAPALGRGEYLFFRPMMKPTPQPTVITLPGTERVIIKEVPPKAKKE